MSEPFAVNLLSPALSPDQLDRYYTGRQQLLGLSQRNEDIVHNGGNTNRRAGHFAGVLESSCPTLSLPAGRLLVANTWPAEILRTVRLQLVPQVVTEAGPPTSPPVDAVLGHAISPYADYFRKNQARLIGLIQCWTGHNRTVHQIPDFYYKFHQNLFRSADRGQFWRELAYYLAFRVSSTVVTITVSLPVAPGHQPVLSFPNDANTAIRVRMIGLGLTRPGYQYP